MNRKIGYGVVTTNDLICVDKAGRTARHIEGRIRVDYMESGHYWLIINEIRGFGESIPNSGMPVNLFVDKEYHEDPAKSGLTPDCGEVWIPDRMVASIRWYSQEW